MLNETFLWFSNTVIRTLLFLKPQNSQDDFHIIPLFFWRVIGFASRVILKVILKELWDYDLGKKFDFPTRVQSSEFLKAIHMAEGDNTMLLLSFLLRLTHMSDLLHQPSSFRCFYMWIFHACTGYQMVWAAFRTQDLVGGDHPRDTFFQFMHWQLYQQ